jgi:hypothetical protein
MYETGESDVRGVVRERGRADLINTRGQHVEANAMPRVREAPGIVSGFWMTDMAGAKLYYEV